MLPSLWTTLCWNFNVNTKLVRYLPYFFAKKKRNTAPHQKIRTSLFFRSLIIASRSPDGIFTFCVPPRTKIALEIFIKTWWWRAFFFYLLIPELTSKLSLFLLEICYYKERERSSYYWGMFWVCQTKSSCCFQFQNIHIKPLN